jgi:hypothetical protein
MLGSSPPVVRAASPKGLPGPVPSDRRVLLAVHDQPTGGADLGAHAQALLHTRPTPTALLAGVGRRDREPPTASGCGFALEEGADRRPAGIPDARGQGMVPDQRADEGGPARLRGRRSRWRGAAPAPSCGGSQPVGCARRDGRWPAAPRPCACAGSPSCGARNTPSALGERRFRRAELARVLEDHALRGDEDDLQPHVEASVLAGLGREWLDSHLGTRDDGVPAIGFLAPRERAPRARLGGAFQGTTPPHGHTATRGAHQEAVVQPGTIARRRSRPAGR